MWAGLWHADADASAIVRDLRAPRVVLAFLVGGSLGICGAALQAMIRNPLAEPYLLGLSSGAGLGAVIAIATRAGGAWAVPLAAFVGALVGRGTGVPAQPGLGSASRSPRAAALGRGRGRLRRRADERGHGALRCTGCPQRLPLAARRLRDGILARARACLRSTPPFPSLLILFHARSLDLIALGDEPAHHLGAEVDRLRRVVYLSTALLTAASVATCGIIGFVGLVVPHAVRTMFRPLHRTLLPLVFLVGGCFLVLADVVSRTAVRPLELPVGVITALIGVPLFALLLRRTLT